MKTFGCLLAISLFALLLTGCAGNETVATERLETSFASADAAAQASVTKAVAAIKSGEPAAALAELETLAADSKLTPEQGAALRDVMAQVKRALSDTAKEAVDNAGKSLDKVKKSLPK